MPDGPNPPLEPAVRIPAGEHEEYAQLARSAAILGRGLVDLVEAARIVGAPDPESLGALGADWDNLRNTGIVVRAWARLVSDALARPPSGLIVVERKLRRPGT